MAKSVHTAAIKQLRIAQAAIKKVEAHEKSLAKKMASMPAKKGK